MEVRPYIIIASYFGGTYQKHQTLLYAYDATDVRVQAEVLYPGSDRPPNRGLWILDEIRPPLGDADARFLEEAKGALPLKNGHGYRRDLRPDPI